MAVPKAVDPSTLISNFLIIYLKASFAPKYLNDNSFKVLHHPTLVQDRKMMESIGKHSGTKDTTDYITYVFPLFTL